MSALAEVDAARAQYDLAQASRVPNLGFGPFFDRSDSGTQSWGFVAQVNLPIVNTGKPLVRQRRAELHQKQIALQQLELKARLEVQATVERYEQARRVAGKSRGQFDSLSREVEKIEKLFEAGQVDLLRVFTARRSVLQVRRNHMEALNALAQAAAELTQATGMDPKLLFPQDANQQP